MLSRLAQGVNSVLQELSGEEPPDGTPQEGLVPQPLPDDGDEAALQEPGVQADETLETLAQTEQLVVQLKELIREKDNQLASTERQHKEEREAGDARFTKLKLQAKAKMAALNKQISELKGKEGLNVSQSSEGSFTVAPGVEEELQQLRAKLQEEESAFRTLQQQLKAAEQLLNEKEQGHVEQVHRLQAVIGEKDVRFQEQIQKHEEELLTVSAQAPVDTELQQALRSSQRRVEELEESLHSRQQVLEMLQQELNSADQQKQILTTQFREMEQELADRGRLREEERQQWMQQASQTQAELGSLRASLEASERQREGEAQQRAAETEELRGKLDAAGTERGKSDGLEAELAALRASLEVAMREREGAERTMEARAEARDAELAELREQLASAEKEKEEGVRREGEEVQRLEVELATLRKSLEAGMETQGEGVQLKETLGELWRRLHSLTSGGPVEGMVEEGAVAAAAAAIPSDPGECLAALQALEAMMQRLRAEREEREAQLDQVTVSMTSLRGQLDKNTAEREDAVARIQELEQQINIQVTGESASGHVTDPSQEASGHATDSSQEDLMRADTGTAEEQVEVSSLQSNILALEQQLREKEDELVFLKDQLAVSSQQKTECQEPDKDQCHEGTYVMQDGTAGLPDILDDTTEGETTLVADESSIMYTSADTESSPELLQPQNESPGESKGASSDEMVTSSDSEVAHSSWTLLEAVNQDGGQEWPSVMQELSQLQSWEETAEQERSTSSIVQVESSSVVIRETVQLTVGQQMASLVDGESGPGQVFAQVLAEEIQKKYSELLAELERLRALASESEEKARGLEEHLKSVTVSREEAATRAVSYEEELKAVKAEMDKLAQQVDAAKVLEEQLSSLESDSQTKEQKILGLQADLDQAQCSLVEQEGQARMLSAQLEDRELIATELEQRLRDVEARLLEVTQVEELAETSLCEKTAEIEDLQLRLTEKEQEMMQLNDSMNAKLQQAGEERFQVSSEVKKLKQHILEMESVSGEQGKEGAEGESDAAHDSEDLDGWRKEKEDLLQQMSTMKKDGNVIKRKLQAALVQRKELMKKVAAFETQAEKAKEQGEVAEVKTSASPTDEMSEKEEKKHRMEALLEEARQTLSGKEEALEKLEHQMSELEKALTEAHAENQRLAEEFNSTSQSKGQELQDEEEKASLQGKVGSLESELERVQKKLQDAEESRKDTIRKAKEKDRHHRDQLKQQRVDHSALLDRFEGQSGQLNELLNHLKELEEMQMLRVNEEAPQTKVQAEPLVEKSEKSSSSDWVQEDWVDFAAPETEAQQKEAEDQSSAPTAAVTSSEDEATLKALREEIEAEQAARAELDGCLKETQSTLSLREAEILELGQELQTLKEKDLQIDVLSTELEALREKCVQAEVYAEMLKKEVEEVTAAAKASLSDSASPMALLQAEVDEFKQFLNDKNDEIMNLSQQLSDQNTLLQKMQETVSEKDQLNTALRESLTTEQEKSQRLEAEVPLRQEEDKDSNAKLQHLQRKLQAALISRKEALKGNSTLKEEHAAAEKAVVELQKKLENGEVELSKLRAERERLIEEVDRSLVENQSLGASCESLKLAMDSLLSEKETCRQQADSAKEKAAQESREWEEKVQGMKDEYETLLKSYENVSDEAERVRRVLEAARQERQELAAKARVHDAARQEAEKLAEEAQKEVDTVKDKMRKFAKTKQQKIMELEEENERLREQEERTGFRRDDRELKQELQRVKEELETLRVELESAKSQRDSLEQQAVDLMQQLSEEKERVNSEMVSSSTSVVVEEVVVAQESSVILTEMDQGVVDSPPQPTTDPDEPKEPPQQSEESVPQLVESAEGSPKIDAIENAQDQTQEDMRELETSLQTAQNSVKELEAALEAEKQSRGEREAEITAQLISLQQQLEDAKGKEDVLKEEICKREEQLKELRVSLEAEKDDLEERLMNQLAEINGSIAGYQQEAADSRDRLADLQREVERLERERAELEALVENEKDRGCRLEEDKRQAQRERAEAEAETGKQRELEQKLKSAQRVKEGSQSRARQLEELLRDKQLEVRQMQKDCIQYQERISELGKETKALLLIRDEVKSELESSRLETADALEEKAKTEQELSECKGKLEETQKAAIQAQSESTALKEAALKREAKIKAEAEETLDEVRYRLGAEMKHLELQLEESYRERERDEEVIQGVRHTADVAKREAQEMQARLDESLARLTAFSRSMSSLQDDRDRVMDEAQQWENRFRSTLQGKEAEVQEAEKKAHDMSVQLQKETTKKDELQVSLERLQKAEVEWQARWDEVEKKHSESMAALEKERGDLKESLTQAESSLAQARSQLTSLETEVEGQRPRTSALEEAVGKLQGALNEARVELREKEAEERRLGLSLEQLETDLRSSKNLTESLQAELSEKEKREVELLGEKDQAVTQAVEEARREADLRAEMAEKEVEERREEVRDLKEKLRKAEEDIKHSKARLEAFTKAMGSLQDDRDRVLTQYKQLEERHLQVMMEKDGLIQEAAGENNSLKEETRRLLVQRDDLHAEKAQLAAKLHSYRDELNQVLSMKDSQHRQLLAGQREQISTLEREKQELEAVVRDLGSRQHLGGDAVEEDGVMAVERETLSRSSAERRQEVRDAPGAEVEKLREQLEAARERAEDLEETLTMEREVQATDSKELSELRWEGGVLRTETETAEERVAELARDLMVIEQKLLEEREAAAKLRAENEAFGRAMSSLQDARDRAISEARELRGRVDEMAKGGQKPQAPSSGGSTGEVWGLKNALSALQNERERLLEHLQRQDAELTLLRSGDVAKFIQELAEERKKATEKVERLGREMKEKDAQHEMANQELEVLRLEQVDWQDQAELLKQQTLTTLSDRDQQLRQMTAMLEEARAQQPKVMQEQEQYQREENLADSAPGGPQEKSENYRAEVLELQRRLDEELEQRTAVEEQLMAAQDRLERFAQAEWQSAPEGRFSETAVLIDPPEGAVIRGRSGGPGLVRMLRAGFCSRQRTPLLVSLYLLTVHVLLLMCLGGYL
ncbi:golgin subfamily B member 1 [Clupea harengus]|uniref:Golgin subfamily B member 1 n=1 Tax=Clupea harengus TaxID=7950 RepID=A0A6P3WAG6_CLUHA|nr:golgin subfamily B member 1 [Clupea harengus]